MKKNQSGFTLIELLVVIAIIGILAAVVLASLNDARKGGSDASIKQTLGNARSQAEIVYNRNSVFSYAGVCTDPKIIQLVVAANNASGNSANAPSYNNTPAYAAGKTICNSSATAWAIKARLASNNSAYWCVDSNGTVASTTTGITTGTDTDCN